MIQLHPDYLIFQTSQGELIPCSAESVTIELMGDASTLLDQETVREAAAAVVHYFKHDLGQDTVSVGEFSKALERVLNAFGFNVTTSTTDPHDVKMVVADLEEIAKTSDDFELSFFRNLRIEFEKQVKDSPDVLSFCGLRPSVKMLVGAKRWCGRCESLSDQIVDFLRECLTMESGSPSRALVVK
jgi:hypothetical protein